MQLLGLSIGFTDSVGLTCLVHVKARIALIVVAFSIILSGNLEET